MPAATGYTWLDVLIGFVVSLLASVMNAAGLNLLKLDHVRNSKCVHERQRHECGRPLWHVGLYLYVGSQAVGGIIALHFLKAQWVAPLGSIALIFNFVFAKILVGTRIAKTDIIGTIVVVISVVWIVSFGGMKSGADIKDSLTITELRPLFPGVVFVVYFSILNLIVVALLSLGLYAYWAISLDDESGQLRRKMKARLPKLLGFGKLFSGLALEGDEGLEDEARDLRMRKAVAIIMATTGGLIASQTLLLAKSGIKLVTSTLSGQNQFQDVLSFFIILVLVLTAILQIYCLNTALKLYDSVLVVPRFYGYYTAFGLINSTIYLNQIGSYQPWVLFVVVLGMGTLVFAVRMLSAPKSGAESGRGTIVSTARDKGLDDDGEEGDPQLPNGGLSVHNKGKGKGKAENPESPEGFLGNGDNSMIKRSSRMDKEMQKNGSNEACYTSTMGSSGAAGSRVISANTLLLDFVATRRSSLAHTTLDTSAIREGPTNADYGSGSKTNERRRTLPKTDTGFLKREGPETRKDPTSARLSSAEPRPMSPSEFRALYTDSPLPLKPKCLQDRVSGLGGSRSSSPAPVDGSSARGRSPRWTTGHAKIDDMFEGLNPLKAIRRGSVDSHGSQDSLTGLPSEWARSLRESKHIMLSKHHARSSSVGSGQSCRSAAPSPGSRNCSPARARRSSMHEGGTPPPMSALPGGSSFSSFDLPPLPRQRNLSCTVKGDHGFAAAFVGLSGGGGATSPLSTSTGTFGGASSRSPSVEIQPRQLQQQYYLSSRLKTSITKESIGTTESTTPCMSTSTSFVQLADDDGQQISEGDNMAMTNTGNQTPFTTSTSLASLSFMKMTPSQWMQATELEMDELERELRESLSGTKAKGDDE
ncbi:MAG: hypothetical protein J3Q66DRAFT_382801 [Benniella sp.]|nr:MAG: hypothetical protein J3Q66DRAFT_382801 [Benniella sp.]